jgi:hypothetical protein
MWHTVADDPDPDTVVGATETDVVAVEWPAGRDWSCVDAVVRPRAKDATTRTTTASVTRPMRRAWARLGWVDRVSTTVALMGDSLHLVAWVATLR